MNKLFGFILLLLVSLPGKTCQCPTTSLSKSECSKYEIIFKGKVLSVADCDHRPGEAIFKVEELYKGNATEEFKVIFECKGECAKKFSAGEEWIIYTRYKQIENAQMDWCSRSRKHFAQDKEDYYLVNYGNTYDEEVTFLRDSLGLYRLLETKAVNEGRNKKPDGSMMIIILLSSIATIVIFYYLFNRFFK